MTSTTKLWLLCALALTACGKTSDSSSTQDVEDVSTMIARGDGTFDVVCRDGSREVATADDIRLDRVCDGGSSTPGQLICVARDNDNRDPWVFARFTDSGSIVKIPDFQFSTRQGCEQSLQDGANMRSTTFVCVARDNDNRDPWIRAGIDANGAVTRLPSQFSTYLLCKDSLTAGRAVNDGLISCVARDNDNRDPWIYSALSASGETRVAGPQFSTAAACQTSLADGRMTTSSLLVCVARDNDNRDPWIIGSVKATGEYIGNTSTTFSTLAQCQQTLRGG